MIHNSQLKSFIKEVLMLLMDDLSEEDSESVALGILTVERQLSLVC